jgi:large subunit ribosomal protein L21
MRYAIIESGGKQYRAVEGTAIEVDRLGAEKGKQIEIERILFMADGDEFMIGTPTVGGIEVRATVLDHMRGGKVFRFKYSPKKRIRVRGGHRQQYTRLMVDFIGKPGEDRKIEKAQPKPAAEKKAGTAKGEKPAKTAAKKAEKAPARKPAKASDASASKAKKPAEKKPSAGKKSGK